MVSLSWKGVCWCYEKLDSLPETDYLYCNQSVLLIFPVNISKIDMKSFMPFANAKYRNLAKDEVCIIKSLHHLESLECEVMSLFIKRAWKCHGMKAEASQEVGAFFMLKLSKPSTDAASFYKSISLWNKPNNFLNRVIFATQTESANSKFYKFFMGWKLNAKIFISSI